MPANINYGSSIQAGFQSNRDTFRTNNTQTNYGAWAGATGAVISGFFDARAQQAQAQAQAQSQQMDSRAVMHGEQSARKQALEDRRYMEDGSAAFRSAYKGSRPVMAPELTDPNTVVVTDPFKKK